MFSYRHVILALIGKSLHEAVKFIYLPPWKVMVLEMDGVQVWMTLQK
jgi:starvation-inducible outer membrane lipoprotein